MELSKRQKKYFIHILEEDMSENKYKISLCEGTEDNKLCREFKENITDAKILLELFQ